VRREGERQLKALRRLTRTASEYAPTLSHLELILDLPWHRVTEDRHDLARARAVLAAGHHGLSEVKERVLEHLAVMQLNPEARAPIVCFSGPPGTGKTSLGRSIAEALGRRFDSLSLGGMHDEGELRGHRRTYVAAMPGRVLTALRRAGARNPVLMLDEIDKLGAPSHQGDPAAALMEILDPRENVAFRDNYLDLPFDLSGVFFITTANNLEAIPRPLQDRLEVISFSAYTLQEKLQIARGHLWPRQLREAGLRPEQVELPDASLEHIIERHTCEAGVRQLERALARLARQLALRIAERGEPGPFSLEGDLLRSLLGREPYRPARARLASPPGVAAGVGWTEAGGDVLYVEAVVLPGPPGLTLTGQLGEVMQESAQTALTVVAARGLGDRRPKAVHIHVPVGSVRKDGPSAGAPLVAALASTLTGRPVRPDTAMTGEITLSGLLLPVGGIRNKALAAQRAGLRRLVLPAANEPDLEEIPAEVRGELELVLVADVDALLAAVLGLPGARTRRASGAATRPAPAAR
jgi:ATP-dependent Lon protease